MKHNKWEKDFLKNWDDMLIDDNIPWTEEDKQVLIDDISSLLKEQREEMVREMKHEIRFSTRYLRSKHRANLSEAEEKGTVEMLIKKDVLKILSILKGNKK